LRDQRIRELEAKVGQLEGALGRQAQGSSFHEAVRHEILQERVSSSRNRINPCGVKRKRSNYNLRPRQRAGLAGSTSMRE